MKKGWEQVANMLGQGWEKVWDKDWEPVGKGFGASWDKVEKEGQERWSGSKLRND